MKKQLKSGLWLVGILLFGFQVEADTVTLSGAGKITDTYFRSDDKAGVYSASGILLAGTLPNGNVNNIAMKFDFSSLPDPDQIVQSAVLTMVFDKTWANQTANVTIEIHEIAPANAGWDAAEANWNRRDLTPSYQAWAGGGNGCSVAGTDYTTALVGSAVAIDGAASGVLEFTMDAGVVQNWIDNPGQNYGIVLVAPGAAPGAVANFSSTEGTIVPVLTLDRKPRQKLKLVVISR